MPMRTANVPNDVSVLRGAFFTSKALRNGLLFHRKEGSSKLYCLPHRQKVPIRRLAYTS